MPRMTEPWQLEGGGIDGVLLPVACHYVLGWLLTFVFHVPLQGIRLGAFFARLALYVVFLWPAMICGLIYWAFAGKDILSVKYKAGGCFRHTLDIYLPGPTAKAKHAGKDASDASTPVLILVAGGAFIVGHKGFVTMLCRALRRAGILCIAVDYRYWPQTNIEGMIEDVDSAIRWTFQNCSKYGGDPKRVASLGCTRNIYSLTPEDPRAAVRGCWGFLLEHTWLDCL